MTEQRNCIPSVTRGARMKTSLKFTAFSKRAKWVIYLVMTLAMVNFFAFVVGSAYLGGDALNGYVRAGHYFVCAHGGCAEVSSAIWRYSYWHAYACFGGILLVFAVTALFPKHGRHRMEVVDYKLGTRICRADIDQGPLRVDRTHSTRVGAWQAPTGQKRT